MPRLSLICLLCLLTGGVLGIHPSRENPRETVSVVVESLSQPLHGLHDDRGLSSRTGDSLSPVPSLPVPEIPAGATVARARGAVVHWWRCPAGQIQGVRLDDGTEVRFPSYPADPLAEVAPPEQPVEVIGWRFPGDPVLHARWIRNPQSADEAEVDLPPL